MKINGGPPDSTPNVDRVSEPQPEVTKDGPSSAGASSEEAPLGVYAPGRPGSVASPDEGGSALALRAGLRTGGGGLPPGPLDPKSPAGRAAVAKIRSALPRMPTGIGGETASFEPIRAFVDQLGITHVRLQPRMGETPIFGEHVNAQIRPGGRVSWAGSSTDVFSPAAPMYSLEKPSAGPVIATAREFSHRRYGAGPSMKAEATPVLIRHRNSDGSSELRSAFHVSVADFACHRPGHPVSDTPADHSEMRPVLVNLLVDAESGEIVKHWNQLHHPHRRGAGQVALRLENGTTATAPFGPNPVRFEVPFSRDLTVERATLKLGSPSAPGIEHDWRGDVVLKVISPDGRTTELAPHEADDSRDDVSGDFDLSSAFRGARAAGSWIVEVTDRFPRADDGVVRRIDLVLEGPRTSSPTEPPTVGGDDFGPYVGRVNLSTTPTDRGFVLTTPDNRVETRDARAQDPNRVAGRFDLGTPFVDADDRWGGPNASTRELAAVETHHSATTFLPFLTDVFGLDSLDNQGMRLQALSNVGVRFNNAFWFRDVFHIGHGDGRVFDRLSSIDIVGHELAHGITEKSANLIYDDQSGGLNESYSDIVGTLFEWWQSKQPGAQEAGVPPFDWKIGEDVFTPQGPDDDALRSMKDPLTDGVSIDHFSAYSDDVGVHFSSGIQNNAFYLAVEGGTHRLGGQVEQQGLKGVFGRFDEAVVAAGRIWMRALQFYLTPSSGFSDARAATRLAARDLFPDQPEVVRVLDQAWDAVGVWPTKM